MGGSLFPESGGDEETGFMMMKMAVTLQQSELLKAVTRHLIVVMVDSWLTRPHDPWCIYRNGAQLVRSFSGLIAM